jgi:hypothetical protein
MKTAASLAGGSALGTGSYVNYKSCADAGTYQLFPDKCAALFGPLAHWAAGNPEAAAVLVGASSFALIQGGQWAFGKVMDLMGGL